MLRRSYALKFSFYSDVPVFVSKPHFLDADPVYLSYIDGPKPNRDIHDAFLNVEPVSRSVITVKEFSKHLTKILRGKE